MTQASFPIPIVFHFTQWVDVPVQRCHPKGLGKLRGTREGDPYLLVESPPTPEYNCRNKILRSQCMSRTAFEKKGQPEQCVGGADLTS